MIAPIAVGFILFASALLLALVVLAVLAGLYLLYLSFQTQPLVPMDDGEVERVKLDVLEKLRDG